MCGIAGVAGPVDNSRQRLPAMLHALRHRGPDDRGEYYCPSGQVALGQQRLAILDLSPLGHQPMISSNERYVIVFNGEIYNFRQLRERLVKAGVQLKSHSDTEVILELYAIEGANCVAKLDGMFALAIWDTQAQTLFCARDPLGIKPFYYWQAGKQLAFASEVRALLEADLSKRQLSAPGLEGYLLYGSVQEPYTLVEGILSLPAGHSLLWKDGQATISRFWQLSYPSAAERANNQPNDSSLKTVRSALDDSIERHFVSDVPVGIFLSGGIDSTAVLALAHAQQISDLQTFCISFEQPEFDEGGAAARTAKHFQTDHHQWRMSPDEGKQLFTDFLSALDQPSNDGFNTFCVSTFARRCGLKVVLSGLGGDELFGGYPSFQFVPRLMDIYRQWRWLRPLGKTLLGTISPWLRSLRYQRLLTYLASSGSATAAHWTVRGFFLPQEVEKLAMSYGIASNGRFDFQDDGLPTTPTDQVAWLETTRYMRNQLLRDSDVMSMSVGLELRTPLVDRKLWDVVTGLPSGLRLQPGKKLLTDAVPEIPEWILGGPKRGFRFPFEDWMKGEWSELFTDLDQRSPVPLTSWSRKWSLLVLEHFLSTNKISLATS